MLGTACYVSQSKIFNLGLKGTENYQGSKDLVSRVAY